MLKALAHSKIISIDIDDSKLQLARDAGASFAFNSRREDIQAKIQELIGAGESILNIVDFVGGTQTVTLALSLIGKGGKIVTIGLAGGAVKFSPVLVTMKSISILGNITGTLAHMKDVIEMAKAGKLAPIPVSTTDWDNAYDALLQLRDGKVQGRLILTR